jgi:cysteine desulfurase/selenocysteine lyase
MLKQTYVSDFPALKNRTYLDNAGAGLPSARVSKAIRDLTSDWELNGEKWEEWLLDVVQLRKEFARLVGGEKEEIAVVPSVSVGLSSLASSLKFVKRKKVVVSELNFPTNVVLWQRMRESKLVKEVVLLRQKEGVTPIESFEREVDDETALIAIDYVSWFSGARHEIKQICNIAHEKGALVVVDAFHAVSVIPLDVKADNIDMLVCGFYKWLCGPHGAACVYINKELLREMEPSYIGWHGIEDNVIERLIQGRDPFDRPFPLDSAKPSNEAARFEWGTWSPIVVRGALEATKYVNSNDKNSRFQTIRKRKREVMEGIANLGIKPLTPGEDINPGAGIVTFPAKSHHKLVSWLKARQVIVSGRFDHVRVSPHFYNTSEDVERLLTGIKRYMKEK